MTNIPVIAFAAYSGTGKTTLIEKLVCELEDRGLRLAVIKHDGHKFEIGMFCFDLCRWRYRCCQGEIFTLWKQP